ncbi:MAG: EAL domain-containing protein, partial [Gammaproteobacteria bacterium]|nr:EAL domain-containing protein [Gammaproteobacteria bacterium]
VFNPLEELEHMANRGNIIAQIRHALETDAFKLEFQPVISLRGDSAEHYEAFLRLLNNQGEEIPPTEFQSAAQESGLAMDIERWLISRSVTLLAQHRSKGADTRLILNLSSASLQDPEIVKWISALLKETRLPADALIFQFNDADANNYLKHAKVLTESLQSIHARISLSNFGGALNPYAVLKHLPVDYVKIDESFSSDLNNPDNVEQLKEMIATLHNQGKLTIVSNVDSAIMMPTLWQAGVNYIQGNYLQPPSDSMNYSFSHE